MTSDQMQQLLDAWKAFGAHSYILAAAILVGLLVSASKMGWLSAFIATRIPASARPWVAVALGIAGTVSTEVQAGRSWKLAVLDGVYAAAIAVLGHQTVVEGMRGGREILPTAPWCRTAPANTNTVAPVQKLPPTPPSDPPKQAA